MRMVSSFFNLGLKGLIAKSLRLVLGTLVVD